MDSPVVEKKRGRPRKYPPIERGPRGRPRKYPPRERGPRGRPRVNHSEEKLKEIKSVQNKRYHERVKEKLKKYREYEALLQNSPTDPASDTSNTSQESPTENSPCPNDVA